MIALARARIALIGAALFIVVGLAGRVFDASQLTLLLPTIAIIGAALALIRHNAVTRFAGWAAASVVGLVLVAVIEGGSVVSALTSLFFGFGRLRSTEWPSPERADLITAAGWMVAVLGGLAADLAGRRRLHLLPLLPLLALVTLMVSLASPAGPQLWLMLAFALLAAIFTTLRPGSSWTRRLNALNGERRLLPILLVALGVAGVVSIPLTLNNRADPRTPPIVGAPETLVDPAEATRALRSLEGDDVIPLFTIEVTDGSSVGRWRTAALDTYDGQRWAPDLTLREIGRRLDPRTDRDIAATITYESDTLAFVPLPGHPLTVSTSVLTDAERSVVLVADGVEVGQSIDVTSLVASAPTDELAAPATREIDPEDSVFKDAADELAGGDPNQPLLSQLLEIEAALAESFEWDPGAGGDGLQRKLLDRFVNDTERGTQEQFAAAFVLMARSLGVDARLAAGFVIESPSPTMQVTSEHAALWPEVRFGDGRDAVWVAFDPMPDERSETTASDEAQSPEQTPGAPQLSAPQPEQSDTDAPPDPEPEVDERSAFERFLATALRISGIVGLVLLPLLITASVILVLKLRRRRRLLDTESPLERIRAHWVITTNELVDAGLDIEAGSTDTQVAAAATPHAPSAHNELGRLAHLAQHATFGQPERADVLMLDAEQCSGAVRQSIAQERSWVSRWKWRLSLRSLRNDTRSPMRESG